MRILFTGHKGFLGRELIPELEKDFDIRTFDGDLQDFPKLSKFVSTEKIESVIHAAVRGGRRTHVDTHEDLAENLKTSINAFRLGIPLLSFCSGKVYDWSTGIENRAESAADSTYPKDFYGQSKHLFRKISFNEPEVKLVRFFNVFGPSESSDRFIKANISRYANNLPMQIHNDLIMDFFYVNDTVPLLKKWILGGEIPKEINMVYAKKYLLSEVCALINKLDQHQVNIEFNDLNLGKNYFGNGELLLKQGFKLNGLLLGLEKMYEFVRANLNQDKF